MKTDRQFLKYLVFWTRTRFKRNKLIGLFDSFFDDCFFAPCFAGYWRMLYVQTDGNDRFSNSETIQYHYLWVKEQLFYFHSLAIFHFLFETPFCHIIHHFQVKFYYYLHLFIDRIVISYPINRIRFYKYIYMCILYKILLFHLYNFRHIINIFYLMIFFIA